MTALFVYGTLLSGCPNEGMLPVDAPRYPAKVRGFLSYNSMSKGYPVLVLDPNAPEVVGELVYMDWSSAPDARSCASATPLLDVVSMELAAGYNAVWCAVDAGDFMEHALVFAWPDHEPTGTRIDSGDWRDRHSGHDLAAADNAGVFVLETGEAECPMCGNLWDDVKGALDCANDDWLALTTNAS